MENLPLARCWRPISFWSARDVEICSCRSFVIVASSLCNHSVYWVVRTSRSSGAVFILCSAVPNVEMAFIFLSIVVGDTH